jgi:hypothetical protein
MQYFPTTSLYISPFQYVYNKRWWGWGKSKYIMIIAHNPALGAGRI